MGGFVAVAFKAVVGFITGSFVGQIVGTVLLSVITAKLFAPKVPKGAGLSGIQLTTRGTLEYRKIVYGQALVSGPIDYQNLSGDDGEDLWTVVPMTDGRCDSLVAIFLDGESIPVADIDWTAGSGSGAGSGTGEVSTARWVGDNDENAVRVYWFLGYNDQPVQADLNTAFSDIDTNYRLRDSTYVVFRTRYVTDTQDVWEEGQITNYKALWKGRPIYDPRLDSTNGGSGSHRYATPSTWEWSDNPSLCLADYLFNYCGVDPATRIDWPSVDAAADDCDVLVDIPPAASPANTEKRFTCNGALSLGSTHRENIDAILSSMDGKLSYSAGTWKVRASVTEAATMTLDDEHFVAPLAIRCQAPTDERFNTVRGFFIDPDRDHQALEFPHVTDASYVTRDDGKTLEADLELVCTNSQYMAQRIGKRILEQGHRMEIVDTTVNIEGAKIEPGMVLDINNDKLGWVQKTFRVIKWQTNWNGTFDISLQEVSSSIYTDPTVGFYTGVTASAPTVPTPVVPAPSNLAANGIPLAIEVTWTNPPASTFDVIEVWESGDNAWSNANLVAETRSNAITRVAESGEQRYYWVRARNAAGRVSIRDPDSDTSTITGTAGNTGEDTFGALSSSTISHIVVGAGTATAGMRSDSDGDVYANRAGGGYTSESTWIGSGANTAYEVMVDQGTGDAFDTSAGEGSWLLCSSDRTWEIQQATNGSKSRTARVRYRRVSDDTVGLTVTRTWNAEKEP